MLRFISIVFLGILVFIVPWWIVFSVGIVFVFIFPSYVEFVLISFMMDVLYSAHIVSPPSMYLTLMSFVVFVCVELLLRQSLRFL